MKSSSELGVAEQSDVAARWLERVELLLQDLLDQQQQVVVQNEGGGGAPGEARAGFTSATLQRADAPSSAIGMCSYVERQLVEQHGLISFEALQVQCQVPAHAIK